jgi:hypothetical protein
MQAKNAPWTMADAEHRGCQEMGWPLTPMITPIVQLSRYRKEPKQTQASNTDKYRAAARWQSHDNIESYRLRIAGPAL